jgi:hypothetical protein
MQYPTDRIYIYQAFNHDADIHRMPLFENVNNLLHRKSMSRNVLNLLPAGARRTHEKKYRGFGRTAARSF